MIAREDLPTRMLQIDRPDGAVVEVEADQDAVDLMAAAEDGAARTSRMADELDAATADLLNDPLWVRTHEDPTSLAAALRAAADALRRKSRDFAAWGRVSG